MTRGIDVEPWDFPYNEEITFRANIWDFGGQEIMHATHRYFLTQRSLYIVLADNRQEDTDFYYWLRMAELLGGNSPVLIVLNEKYDYKKFIPQNVVESFKNIKEVLTINLATNKDLADLTNAIKKHLTTLPHVGKQPLPKR